MSERISYEPCSVNGEEGCHWHFSCMPQDMPPAVVCCHCGRPSNTYMATDKKGTNCGEHAPEW